jgi:hypothetical protein
VLLGVAFVALKCLEWNTIVAAWQTGSARRRVNSESDAAVRAVDAALRSAAAASWFGVECKEVALCGWGLLRWLGLRPRLTIGIELYPFAGHAWCENGGAIIADVPGRCARYTPVWSWS